MTSQEAATLMLLDWQIERDRREKEFRRTDRGYSDTLDLVRNAVKEEGEAA